MERAPGGVRGKALAAESQPFELVAAQAMAPRAWPWGCLAAWVLLVVLGLAAASAWQRQRDDRRRSQALSRLGQVGRLNALGELAAGMAHELNQPLTAVLANVQATDRLLADDPPELGAARHAMQQARRANEGVGRLQRARPARTRVPAAGGWR